VATVTLLTDGAIPGRLAEVEDDTDRATASLSVDFLKPAAIGDWIEAARAWTGWEARWPSPTAR